MAKYRIDLPQETAKAAREAGLLTADALERLLSDALKNRVATADRVADASIPPNLKYERSSLTNITVSLPDDLAQQAQAAGLLLPAALETLLREAMKRRDVDQLFGSIDKLNALVPALTEKEIDAEIAAARAERARRR
jgi:post-segregation antitoxin (ccd killing protein)